MEESKSSPSLCPCLGELTGDEQKKVVTLMSDPHGDEMLEVLKVVATKHSEMKAIFGSPFQGYFFSM